MMVVVAPAVTHVMADVQIQEHPHVVVEGGEAAALMPAVENVNLVSKIRDIALKTQVPHVWLTVKRVEVVIKPANVQMELMVQQAPEKAVSKLVEVVVPTNH